jgi:hypothetical protein
VAAKPWRQHDDIGHRDELGGEDTLGLDRADAVEQFRPLALRSLFQSWMSGLVFKERLWLDNGDLYRLPPSV